MFILGFSRSSLGNKIGVEIWRQTTIAYRGAHRISPRCCATVAGGNPGNSMQIGRENFQSFQLLLDR